MKIQYQDSTTTIFESALYQTTSTVINLEKLILIVDPNWLPIEIETIQIYVSKIRYSKPVYYLLTPITITSSDIVHFLKQRSLPLKLLKIIPTKKKPLHKSITSMMKIISFATTQSNIQLSILWSHVIFRK
jgi:hypothetical protein